MASTWLGLPPAQAQQVAPAPLHPTAPELERARENFARGLEHARDGRFTQAALAFEDAYLRSGNPVALFNWASALRETGQSVRAFEVVTTLLTRHEANLDAETKARAEALRNLTAGRLSLGELPQEAQVFVNGAGHVLPESGVFLLAAGEQRVEVHFPDGRRASAAGYLHAGEEALWALTFTASESAPKSASAAQPARKDANAPRRRRALGIGAAALGIVAGGLALVLARNRGETEALGAPSEASTVFRMP